MGFDQSSTPLSPDTLNITFEAATQTYTEFSQSIKLGNAALWGAPLFVHLGYSGGLGLIGNGSGGFNIPNAFQAGLEYSFQVRGAFCNAYIAARYLRTSVRP